MASHPKSKDLPLDFLGLGRREFLAGAAALGGVALGGLPVLPGGALAQVPQPKRGGTLKVACPPATGIDPVKMDSSGAIAIVQQVAEYLVWAEPDLSLRPVLATSWRPEEGGRSWIFELRRGVRFHDGRDFTADDVVATFQRLVDPSGASAARAQLGFLRKESVSKIDSHTVRFDLDRPVGNFPYYTHVYNAVILPADYKGDFAEKPVGTGPFKLAEYKPQQGARLVRNETYWDEGRPYLDAVEIQNYEAQPPMILAMKSGQADMMLLTTFIDGRPLLDDPNVEMIVTPSAEHRQLTMRTDKKPFDDKRVRQAVALCVDREAMVKGLLGGRADVGNDHPIASIYPEKVKLEQRKADLARARQLLAEAGHPDGFEVELHTAQYQELPQYAALLQQMLAPAGIRVTPKVEPVNVYYDHWTEVTMGLTDWTSRPTAAQILNSAFKGGAEWNAAKWRNEEFDALLEKLDADPDPVARSEVATRIAAIMNEEVPAVVAYFTRNLRPVRKGVHGVPGSASQFLDLTRAWKA